MKVLELFSGTECISSAFRERGHECFTVDWDERFPSSLHCDIGKLTADEIIQRFGKPDVIWAAFDCTTFSVLSMRRHRRKNHVTGEMEPVSDYAKKCDEVDKHCLQLISQLNPSIFIIENPRAGLRTMRWMPDARMRQTTTYCKYGAKYQKPTDFWSNIDLRLREPCNAGADCHEHSSGLSSKTGLLAIKSKTERSMYPHQLCEHIVDVCEETMSMG